MNEELPRIQEQVYYGQINSDTDVLDKFLSESGVQRYNPKVHFDHKFTTSNFNCICIRCIPIVLFLVVCFSG